MAKFSFKNIKIIPLIYIAFVLCTTGLPLYLGGYIFMKKCSKCGIEKTEISFYRAVNGKLTNQCRQCINERAAVRYHQREKVCGIYKITSPTGSIYIGQSCDILVTWMTRYKRCNPHCKSQPALYKSIIKHGWETHTFEIIEQCDRSLLNEKEVYYISFYDSHKNGMNCTIGGEGVRGHKWSDESKKRASESKKKMYEGGYISPLIGKPLSMESRDKLSKHFTGLLVGEKNPFFGRTHTEESKKKIGAKSVGRYFSNEVRQKASERNSGKGNPMYGVRLYGEKNGMYGRRHKKESFHNRSRIILNTETGIFYYGFKEAAESVNSTAGALAQKFRRRRKTPFIYA